MDLPPPATVADVIADGAVAQADLDAVLAGASGTVTGVEYSGPQPTDPAEDAFVDVRARFSGSGSVPLRGVRVAIIRAGHWTWLTRRGAEFPVPELSGTWPASDELLRAARTLVGNVPVLLAPHADGSTSAVAVDVPASTSDTRMAVLHGVAALADGVDVQRALLGFAAARGLGIQRTSFGVEYSDGVAVEIAAGRVVDIRGGASLAEVRADAVFTSEEHQLLLSGMFPQAQLQPDLRTGVGRLSGSHGAGLEVRSEILGVIVEGQWVWAWADPHLAHTPAAGPASVSARVRRFGRDNAIPAFVRPRTTLERARADGVVEAAKPVAGLWAHITAPLTPTVTGVFLLDAPALRLPGATEAAVQATLRTEAGRRVDQERAAVSYARFRRLPHRVADGVVHMQMPDTGNDVTVP